MRHPVRAACVAAALLASSVLGQEDELDRFLRAEMELNEAPGVAVAIVEQGRIRLRAWGRRRLAAQEPMTVDTPVELASVSKPLTAVAVERLARAGKLDLDRPASEWLTELRGGPLAAVTVRALLRQRTGLRRRHDRSLPCCGRPGDRDLKLAARRLARAKPTGASPPPFAYANSNYVLLAALIERVSGEPFGQFMEREVFLPLGMTRTTLDPGRALQWGLAGMHERNWGRVVLRTATEAGWLGASFVKSTARDMAAFLEAALGGRVAGLERPERLAPPYDAGWFVRREGGLLVLEHSGDTWGANAALLLAPERRIGVAVLINAGVRRAMDLARAIALWRLGGSLPPPRRPPWHVVADNWAMFFAGLSLAVLAALALLWGRIRAELRRGERRWALPESLWERGRMVLLAAMAVYLLGLAARGVILAPYGSPPSLRIGLSALALAAAAGLGTVATLSATARRPQD